MARSMAALKGEELSWKDRMVLKLLQGVMGSQKEMQAAFRPDAAWLPFYQTRLCDGSIQSSRDLGRLSEAFGTPVLAFALFDSDVLFVSYRDNAAGTAYDYARLPFENYEEYDGEVYRLGFPEFLASLCASDRREELRRIWEEEDDVFADDRMWKLMDLLGMEAIDPAAKQFPGGFEKVVP